MPRGTGKKFDSMLVMAAEYEEVGLMESLGVGDQRTVDERWEMTGKALVDTKVGEDEGGIGGEP